MIDQYPSANGVLTSLIWRKTASGGETSLSGYDNANQALSYTPGQEQVYLNGILLVRGDDYTATNGTSITGLSALSASDFVQVNCYNNFSVASLPTSGLVGTISNAQLQNSAITINGSAISLGGSVSLPGDIESVTASSPLTGGGTSGAVTIGIQSASTTQSGAVQLSDSTSTTSSILAATPTAVKSAYDLANTANTTANGAIAKSTITTTGDIIYASSANTPARLGIGSTGQVLTVSGGIPTWAAAAGGGSGGMTLITTSTISSGTNTHTIGSISTSYKHLYVVGRNIITNNGDGAANFSVRFNGDTAANYSTAYSTNITNGAAIGLTEMFINARLNGAGTNTDPQRQNHFVMWIPRYTDTTDIFVDWKTYGIDQNTTPWFYVGCGVYNCSAAITSMTFFTGGANYGSGGTIYIYGVN
jgi:hypothetical protein